MQNTYTERKSLYSLHNNGPFRINDLQIAIFKKWKNTFLGNNVIVYEHRQEGQDFRTIERVFEPKHATPNYSEEEFTEITTNNITLENE